MNIIICIDKNNGMSFCGKRQSQDRILREKILEIAGEKKILMNSYSAKLFENKEKICCYEDFLNIARDSSDSLCFVENELIPLDKVKSFYIFNWNRKYPADEFFTVDLKAEGFKRIKKEEFEGSSHDKITLEIYSK